MKRSLRNIYALMIKELRTLFHDKIMLFLIIYSFSFAIYIGGTATSTEIRNASIAFVNEDNSILSNRIISSFYKPRFNTPGVINNNEIDSYMNSGYYTFVVVIPSEFEKNVISGNTPNIQVNIDATRMSQAGIGAGYIQAIINQEISSFLNASGTDSLELVEVINRYKYNSSLESSWFGSINEIISNIVMISILLSAASLIREREHGTIEHLLVMPLNPIEIMLAKVCTASIVVLICVSFSLSLVVEYILNVPLSGSIILFLFCTFLVLFATTSIGIFIGTISKNMPQMGMIFILTILPLMMLSGTVTPYESMPESIQFLMHLLPISHFVDISQAVLFKGAGITIIYKSMLSMFLIGVVFFIFTFILFKRSLDTQK
ncbi:ABC transporter permease [Halarcobacter mediterraneus]|uniref:Transport permease protein n=1 Tax=Halarcobacter mediterraneus TaxID=2023153 RepID=A0A4Q1ASF6_9BACT|nr:ABC transporter permease [Halarcobacter mediterraneus]RXK12613.1 ABC transporter permease [Halarcobacter mediterraneus]